jgi:hypothetical protein
MSLAGEASSSATSNGTSSAPGFDILSATSWPGVDESRVLLQPHEVRTSWRDFMSASNVHVQQALAAQQANKLAGNRAPPFWAILAILFLGWNEFMAVLFNPVRVRGSWTGDDRAGAGSHVALQMLSQIMLQRLTLP